VAGLFAASCGETSTNQPSIEPRFSQQKSDPTMTKTRELLRASPEDVGMSAERLEKIDGLVQEYIDDGRIQGVVIGVARHNKVVYLQAHGVIDDTTKNPMQIDSMFHMVSSTKPILGVAAMMMIEEGLISPEDPVEKYIPEFKGIQVAVAKNPSDKNLGYDTKKSSDDKSDKTSGGKLEKEKVPDYLLEDLTQPLTIHHLLTHTAGLATGGLGTIVSGLDRPGASDTLASWIPKVAAGPLDFHPGAQWAYSGTVGLDVVARIIEIASGTPFNEFVRQRIFEPLNMTDTHWVVPKDKLDRMPVFSNDKGPWIRSDDYFSGSLGLVSTARDYMHFEQMLANKGTLFGHRLLDPESVAMMSTNQVGNLFNETAKGSLGLGFGYTVGITMDSENAQSGRPAGAFGWGGAAGTVSWTAPDEELSLVYMVQQPTDLPDKIAAVVTDAIEN
jgi:CubicO group peptidase (beta-lactamase class C family)